MQRAQPRDPGVGPRQQGGVIQWMRQGQMFQKRRPGGVEMNAQRVKDQPQGRRARPPGQDGAQERILDAQQARAAARGHRLATPTGRAAAPDADKVVSRGVSKADVMARKRQDAANPALNQKAAVKDEQPPGWAPGGCVTSWPGHQFPASVFSVSAVLSDPVIAASVFCQRTNGASVT